jgi:hypothetical protein
MINRKTQEEVFVIYFDVACQYLHRGIAETSDNFPFPSEVAPEVLQNKNQNVIQLQQCWSFCFVCLK